MMQIKTQKFKNIIKEIYPQYPHGINNQLFLCSLEILIKYKEYGASREIVEAKLRRLKEDQGNNNKNFFNFVLMIYMCDILPYIMNDERLANEINRIHDGKLKKVSLLDSMLHESLSQFYKR